jgi:indole-3-glycerol phosphate synthase
MKTITEPLDLDAIAKRIEIAREIYGADFALGSIEFTSGELTPRALVDVLRDQDRVALFLEVKRLQPSRQLLREAYDLLTNPETALDLRDWQRAAQRLLEDRA